ncbi:helix-turn-helix domain-containing protein [Paenibacillus puerhi]|uniref:helix-turn-helix domain-containing protein n=1 Tax=Paenibacillus puerhi TaxID=2692622 RepID=UPI001F42AC66|nr:helix-turn-helix domain-containing protein [Paenibacillus puerhi]
MKISALSDGGDDFVTKPFSLLSYMAQNVNRMINADTLFQLIWGTESLEDTRTVAVHISNLRKKSRLTLSILKFNK